MAKTYDVITMGSGLVDTFLDLEAPEKNKKISFPVGTKIKLEKVNFTTGGGGTNTAVCFAKLGLKTAFLGKVGSGHNSELILRELKKRGIDFLGVQGKEHAGYSIILGTEKHNRTIFTFKGASNNLSYSDISLRKIKTKWLYLTSMGEKSFKSQLKIASWAKKHNIKIAYTTSSYHTKQGVKHLAPLLKKIDLLTLNQEEAKMLVKKQNLFKSLSKLGPKIVCITNGEKQGGVYDREHLYKFHPNKVRVKECTGAGDAFGSSFVAGLIKFGNIESALKVAMINSAAVIQEKGAQNGLLSWPQIKKALKTKKLRITKEVQK